LAPAAALARRQSRPDDAVVATFEVDDWRDPQLAEQGDLLLDARSAPGERHAEGLVLDGVPTDADAQADATAGQVVDLGHLLGPERGLALGQDQDAGDQLDARRAAGQVGHRHQRLVELGGDRVGRTVGLPGELRGPLGAHDGIDAEDVVDQHDMGEAEPLRRLGPRPSDARVGAELLGRKLHPDAHRAHPGGAG
jgi:hypothetical protein